MGILNGKTSGVLDACLSHESPEVRAKVYEIINISGLDADDPLFLILALTGQMRVFLEDAPQELSNLLEDWKTHNAESLKEIADAVAIVKQTQEQQTLALAEKFQKASNQCVAGIEEAGMATTSAIAEANRETLAQAKIASYQVKELNRSQLQLQDRLIAEQLQHERVSNSLLKQSQHNLEELKQAVAEIAHLSSVIKRLQQDTVLVKFADWCSPLLALIIVGGISFLVGLKITSSRYEELHEEHNDLFSTTAREVLRWNVDRYNKCRKDKNPKCTFWIVPPEERK